MKKITLGLTGGLAGVLSVLSTSAMAGAAPVPVSEPGTLGLAAAGIVAALAVARLRRRK